jgi:hypothetical protein
MPRQPAFLGPNWTVSHPPPLVFLGKNSRPALRQVTLGHCQPKPKKPECDSLSQGPDSSRLTALGRLQKRGIDKEIDKERESDGERV